MNREIKFRVWKPCLSGFKNFQGDIVGKRCGHLCAATEQDFFGKYVLGKNATNIYQQYTGLKDKNGREIFEGDILLISDEYGECPENTFSLVQYKDGAFWWNSELLLEAHDYGEVIGNIFDNPELLK